MIACYELTVPRSDREGFLFRDVSFEVGEGEWVEIVGASGCGKSVLFSILSARVRPKRGRLVLAGRNLDRLSRSGWAELRRGIGQCPEEPTFLEERSVLENLLIPSVARDRTEGAKRRAESWLEALEIEGWAERPVGELSRGGRTLIGAIRAGVGRPDLMVFDGVFDGAPAWKDALLNRLELARRAGSTVVIFGRSPTGGAPAVGRRFRLHDSQLTEDNPKDRG